MKERYQSKYITDYLLLIELFLESQIILLLVKMLEVKLFYTYNEIGPLCYTI